MAKKKIDKKEIAKQLKHAVVVESLKDYKTSKDKTFRKHASDESLLPATDLNTEIRAKVKRLRGTKKQIEAQQNKLYALQQQNKKIKSNVKKLEQERIKATPERKKEIDKLLKSPDYKTKDLFKEKNYLKALQGKNFDYVVNDGFKTYRVNVKDLQKYWKQGGDATLPILKKMEKDNEQAIKHYKNLLKKEAKTATKQQLKKWRRILNALETKLAHTIKKNIQAIETNNTKHLDEYNESGEKAYSILFEVIGFNVNRIGI